jgi:hypothetical protein
MTIMKYALVVLGVLALLASAASGQVPRQVFAEDCTATWCPYCPDAYAGLDTMWAHYDRTEFVSVRYYSTSGGYGTSETDARISYYGVTAYPTVIFDGTIPVVGGGSTVASGAVYEPIVGSEIFSPSPLEIRINSVDLTGPDGSIDFDIEVKEDIPDISNVKIRALLLEDNIEPDVTNVTRDVLPDVPLTVSQVGEVQNVVLNFTIDPTWTNFLWMAVFVQDDTDKSILQAQNTLPKPDYSVRAWAKGNRCVVGTVGTPYDYGDFAVFNGGQQPDVIRVALDTSGLPSGWQCVFTDGVNEYTDYVDLSLNPGESQVFHMRLTPTSSGYAYPNIVLTSANLPGVERRIVYGMITDDVDVLLVDDDGAEDYELYHTDALEYYGATYGIWNRNIAPVLGSDLVRFDTVFWEIGLSYPTLTSEDRDALATFLDGGGNLFITGQDLGWETWDQGGDAITWYRTYLHATYLLDDTNRNSVSGVDGDPVSHGMALTLYGGDGANNNIYPDAINPYDSYAHVIFTYDNSNYNGAIRADNGVHKVVYLAFGYEAINNADDRRLLVQRILDWFSGVTSAEESFGDMEIALSAFPNPSRGMATLRFQLPRNADTRLGIYAPDGALVRTLIDGPVTAGQYALRWDGRDDRGLPVASGVYFYRLQAGGNALSGRLILVR